MQNEKNLLLDKAYEGLFVGGDSDGRRADLYDGDGCSGRPAA